MLTVVALLGLSVPILAIVVFARRLLERYVRQQPAEPPPDWPADEFVPLASYEHYLDAQVILTRLHAAGIRCTSVPLLAYPWSGVGGLEVRVLGRDMERARHLLASGPSHHASRRRRVL